MKQGLIQKNQIIITDNSEESRELLKKTQEEVKPIDKLLNKIGGEGRYQKILFAILFSHWFLAGCALLGGAFFFQTVDFDCRDGSSAEVCNSYVCSLPQSQWRQYLPDNYPRSISYEFKTIYVCQYEYVVAILLSLESAGSFVGFFIIPFIADNWGRRGALIISWTFCTFSTILIAAAQNIIMVGIGFFLIGFGSNPAITLAYSFINQQTLGKSRQFYGIGVQLAFSIGQSVIGLLFLLINQWRTVMYIMLGISLVINVFTFYIKESPKFAIIKDPEHTLQILNQIAEINKRQKLVMQDVLQLEQDVSKQNESKKASLIYLFKFKSIRSSTFVTGLVFFSVQLIYYSISFNLSSFNYNIYYLQIFVGISESLSYISAELIIAYIKRKPTSFFGMGISGVLCFLLMIFHTSNQKLSIKILQITLLIVLRFVVSGFWAIFYVYVSQIFPTRVRSLALGWVSALGQVGSYIAPYILLFAQTNHFSGWLGPGILAGIATVSIFILSETFGKSIEDEIEQLKISKSVKKP